LPASGGSSRHRRSDTRLPEESTKHELIHLSPLVCAGGVLIVYDYGHWQGVRKAVKFIAENKLRLLLNRIDYTGRIAIKPD
jgi:O-methyltransferase